MKHLKITFALTVSILLLSSCGGNKKQADQTGEDFKIEDYIKAAEAIEPNLNQVDQIFNILDMVHAEYYDVLTNDPYSAHSYKSSYPVAAANLGIYMTDVVYNFYGENDERTFLTLQAAQELAKYIGVESQFGTWAIQNLEGTMVKRDTLTMMFNNLLMDSEKYTSEKEMVFIHTAFLTGSFIEKVFISGSLLKQKLSAKEFTKEQESDIRELLVIYLNQLAPSTGILYDAFEKQQEQLSGLIILTTFARLEELSVQLLNVKSSMVLAPISEIASNKDLNITFDLISNLRNLLVVSNT